MKTKIFTLFFALVISTGTVLAESGICGDNLTWTLTNNVLTISGTGAMYDFDDSNSGKAPWYDARENIRSVVVNTGVTSIGNYAFSSCSSLISVKIPNGVTRIGNHAFYYCSSLTSITIPNGVTSIENHAFYYCSSLTSITIPNGVTSIGNDAFYCCGSLTSITIPNGVTSIGNEAFYCCKSLTSITIPNSVTSVGSFAFSACSGLTSPVYNSHIFARMPTSYTGTYTIPTGIESIADGAFGSCINLVSVIIPNSVTSIGSSAFSRCICLTSITIPNSVTSIGSSAFINCNGLTSITISNSITSIDKYTFSGCSGLPYITIPDNITSIGERAFYDCYTMDSISLGNGVKYIGPYAFYSCKNLTSITIPNSAEYIEEAAFSDCYNLTNLYIGNGLKRIGIEAFMNCYMLQNFKLPESLQCIKNKAFCSCHNMDSITFPVNVDTVGTGVLADCMRLKYIKWNAKHAHCSYSAGMSTLCTYMGYGAQTSSTEKDIRDSIKTFEFGDQVEEIPQYLCYKMKNIDSLYIPKNVRQIGKYAFKDTEMLRKIVVSQDNETFDSRYDCNAIIKSDSSILILGCGSTIIPNDVNIIESAAFHGNKLLIDMHIPSSIIRIKTDAFENTNLQQVVIDEGVQEIWRNAFRSNYFLTDITIPSSVIKINPYAFAYCYRLINVTYKSSIIGENMFEKCTSLTKVIIPDSVVEMGKYAFNECENLEEVVVGKGLQTIPQYAFSSCKNLKKIFIGKNVEDITYWAFNECNSIMEIYARPYNPPQMKGISMLNAMKIKVYVPCGRLDAYAVSDWQYFNLTYDSVLYTLTGLSNDTSAGIVRVNNELCNNTLEAVPNDSYKFVQWSDGNTENPRYIELIQDTAITAIFATQTFTITFVDDNDTILASQEYEYGSTIVPPTDPIKTNDAQYTYTFAGWSPQFVVVTSDATYKATYTSTLNEYTITFMNEDSILSADMWEYGSTPVYRGSTPTKTEDERYTYTFDAWTPEIVPVVADATYTATFTATEKTEAIENIMDNSSMPTKYIDNNNIYILMPNGKKYSIIGEIVK